MAKKMAVAAAAAMLVILHGAVSGKDESGKDKDFALGAVVPEERFGKEVPRLVKCGAVRYATPDEIAAAEGAEAEEEDGEGTGEDTPPTE